MPIPTIINLKSLEQASGERFDYTGKHRYLLTLPVFGTHPVFAEAARTVAVLDKLREACWQYHFDAYAYCFLPTRLVLIARGREDVSRLKDFLRFFRQQSNDRLAEELGRPLWSRKYLERVLRKTELSIDAAREVFMLPVKEGLAATPAEYPLQGSFVEEMKRFFPPPGRERFSAARTGRPREHPRRPKQKSRRQGGPA
jgi:hypothetical protein